MSDVFVDLEKFYKKLLADLFLEKNGEPNRENIAFFAAFIAFMIASWRATIYEGHWDSLMFGFGAGAILVGGGAAMGAKLKTEAALRRLDSRVEDLEKRINKDRLSGKE
jgi:hypothetical protein